MARAVRRKGKGNGNPGKPGKRLRLEDLQSQFGVGLKEAANRLGICPTTLKARTACALTKSYCPWGTKHPPMQCARRGLGC